jgi:phosphatidate cytidylyltransferase
MRRLLTAAVGVPIALLAIFRLPALPFFLLTALVFVWASIEFVALARPSAPHAPWWLVWLLVPPIAAALAWGLAPGAPVDGFHALALTGAGVVLGGSAVLLARTPVEEARFAAGAIAFAIPYFSVPIAAIARLQQLDPWLVFLLLAIVWLGDTAAYYVGSAFGRHKLSPAISPGKSWEGAVAGFLTSVAAAAVWSLWRRGELDPVLVGIAAVTAVASQLGDLVESIWKRGAGAKDSGGVLPGHGGMLDRMDAMLFAAPTLAVLLWALGYEAER